MRISDWSSDVCSSDLIAVSRHGEAREAEIGNGHQEQAEQHRSLHPQPRIDNAADKHPGEQRPKAEPDVIESDLVVGVAQILEQQPEGQIGERVAKLVQQQEEQDQNSALARSEEHTSELQSLMSSSYAIFCW